MRVDAIADPPSRANAMSFRPNEKYHPYPVMVATKLAQMHPHLPHTVSLVVHYSSLSSSSSICHCSSLLKSSILWLFSIYSSVGTLFLLNIQNTYMFVPS